ncbi:hypothetical protein D3C85_1328790 [compost metagenome]
MSLGFALPPITPSTTVRGSDPEVSVPVPRIRIEEELPGCPDAEDTITPAAFPCNRLPVLLLVTSINFSAETVETELTICDLFFVT